LRHRESLAAKQTIADKKRQRSWRRWYTPPSRSMACATWVMTTGTPKTLDRGAAKLSDCARAIRQRTDVPIQGQCEPPGQTSSWFERLRRGRQSTSLGMHLEAVSEEVRLRIMPGKAQVSLAVYYQAFERAVRAVFGWGQVSTYILAGALRRQRRKPSWRRASA